MTAPNLNPQPLNVIEMLRVSSDKQDVERQEYDTADNRTQYGLNVIDTIRIKISGTLVWTHPEVQAMLLKLAQPGVDAISVSAIDRIFRPKGFDLRILQFLYENKKAIVSAKEGIVEPWMPRGWTTCMDAAKVAGAFLLDLKRNTSGGRKKTQKQNKMCYTTAPYGMVYVDKYSRDAEGRSQYLIEDPSPSSMEGISKKQVVQMVFSWRHEQKMRTSAIVRTLNRMGILTGGKPGQWEPGLWSRQTVIQMLKRRKYMGEHIEDGVVMACPKFVEPEIFEAVQKAFAEQKKLSNGRPPVKHLLCGFLRCKLCQGRLRSKAQRGKAGWIGAYCCHSHQAVKIGKRVCANGEIRCHLLEAVIWKAIWAHLTDAELLLANAQAYYDSLPSAGSTSKLQKELAAVLARVERIKRMVKAGAEDEAKGTAEILEDLKQAAGIQAQLRAAGSVMSLPPAAQVKAACERLAKGGAKLVTFEERRPVLEKLVDLEMIWDSSTREVEISGKVPVPAMQSKCNSRQASTYTSAAYIPFKIKERVAA